MCKRNCNNSSGFDLWWVGFIDDSYRFLAIILTVYLQLRSEIIRDNGSIGSYYPFHGSGSRFSSTRDIEYPIYVIWSARIKRKFCFQPIAVPRCTGEIDIRKGMKIPLPSFRGGEGTKGALRGEEGRDISRFDICLLSEERASRKMKVENEGVREG